MGFLGGASGKEPNCQCRKHNEIWVPSRVWKMPWRRAWQPTPVFFPAEFHEQRSLVGCSPSDHKELDTTEVTQHIYPYICYSHLLLLVCILFIVQSLSCVRLFVTLWIAAGQASLSINNSWSLLKLISIESVMLHTHRHTHTQTHTHI